MIAGYHLIWTAYGWWLPNDPRGSMSHEIREVKLEPLGELHYGRKVFQPCRQELLRFYHDARALLKHELLTFDANERLLLAEAFCQTTLRHKHTCYACAIKPDHVHMLIRKHRQKAEEVIANLQSKSRELMIRKKHRPPAHPVWGGPGWKVFLETPRDFERTIKYIQDNPLKARMPDQRWPFVKIYDGWVPGVPSWLRKNCAKP